MVDGVNSGFQQIPAANTFQPGEQRTRVAIENEAVTNPNPATNQGENLNLVQEGNRENLAASSENSVPNPNDISSSSNRGSQLDITV